MTIADRFTTAAGSPPPTDEQRALVAANTAAIVAAAEQLDTVPAGRHKALALTALEEALMWANKAVFAPAEPKRPSSPCGGAKCRCAVTPTMQGAHVVVDGMPPTPPAAPSPAVVRAYRRAQVARS